MWIVLALVSAFLTAAVGTLTKAGTERVEPAVALAVQATVLTVCVWTFVVIRGKLPELATIPAKAVPILVLAGALTCVAYLFYFGALALGSSSAVQPVDRLSLVFAVGLAGYFLKEKVTPTMLVGVGLMTIGAIVIAFGSPPEKKGEVRAAHGPDLSASSTR